MQAFLNLDWFTLFFFIIKLFSAIFCASIVLLIIPLFVTVILKSLSDKG